MQAKPIEPQPGTSGESSTRPSTPEHFSSEDVRLYPTAGARKKTRIKKCKTLILTDTPVKQQLVGEIRQREIRKQRGPRQLSINPR